MLVKLLIALAAATLTVATPGLSGATDALSARNAGLEKRGSCNSGNSFGMNCVAGGICFDHEVNCCYGAGTYCEYGYACIENGTKCCPVGKWCPSWWPWKRDAKDNGVVAEAVDAGAA